MSKNITGGYSPRAQMLDGETRGYKPLTEGFKPQGNDDMPVVIPAPSVWGSVAANSAAFRPDSATIHSKPPEFRQQITQSGTMEKGILHPSVIVIFGDSAVAFISPARD